MRKNHKHSYTPITDLKRAKSRINYHSQFLLYVLVETGFHHVGQDGLELLTSGNPPPWHPKVLGLICGHPPDSALFSFFLSKYLRLDHRVEETIELRINFKL